MNRLGGLSARDQKSGVRGKKNRKKQNTALPSAPVTNLGRVTAGAGAGDGSVVFFFGNHISYEAKDEYVFIVLFPLHF